MTFFFNYDALVRGRCSDEVNAVVLENKGSAGGVGDRGTGKDKDKVGVELS